MHKEVHNFEIQVSNIFLTNSYNIKESEKVPIIINLLDCEGLRPIQTLNDNKKENFKTSAWLVQMLTEKIKPQHNETILLLQYSKLIREGKEVADKWMDFLSIKENECEYEEEDKQWKEQFINGINDEHMMTEIIKKLSETKRLMITWEQILSWVKRMEAQRAQKDI